MVPSAHDTARSSRRRRPRGGCGAQNETHDWPSTRITLSWSNRDCVGRADRFDVGFISAGRLVPDDQDVGLLPGHNAITVAPLAGTPQHGEAVGKARRHFGIDECGPLFVADGRAVGARRSKQHFEPRHRARRSAARQGGRGRNRRRPGIVCGDRNPDRQHAECEQADRFHVSVRSRASAREAAFVEEPLLLRPHRPSENRIAMREAAEAPDDVAVALGERQSWARRAAG